MVKIRGIWICIKWEVMNRSSCIYKGCLIFIFEEDGNVCWWIMIGKCGKWVLGWVDGKYFSFLFIGVVMCFFDGDCFIFGIKVFLWYL